MKTLRILACLLLLFNGTGAIFGGWSFIQDPTGAGLKIPTTYLEHSPFQDFLIPGIVLFTVNGVLSMVTLVWTLMQWKHYGWLIMLQGAMLVGWIIIQMLMIREIYYLQFIFGGIGIILLWIGWTLKVKSEE